MRADEDGLPRFGESGRYLGARPSLPGREPDGDIPATEDGAVHPGTGGMSVSPPPVDNLPPHRRPPEYGGTGKDPVFELETDGLSGDLRYRPDPYSPARHGFIEPSRAMSFEEYRQAIFDTRILWRAVR